MRFGYAPAAEDVFYFPNAYHVHPGGIDEVEYGVGLGRERIVAPVGRAVEFPRLARKGTRYHARHAVFALEQGARFFAHFVKLGDRIYTGVAGDLEHAVGGGVDNGIPRANVFLAVILYDFGAGIWPVAQHFGPHGFFKGAYDFVGEPFGIYRERALSADAGDLPVAHDRVFARGTLGGIAVRAARFCRGPAAFQRGQIEQPALCEVGNIQIGAFGERKEGVRTGVAVKVGVGQLARSGAVKNYEKYAFFAFHIPLL